MIAAAIRQQRCVLVLGGGAHVAPPDELGLDYSAGTRPLVGSALSQRLAADCNLSGRLPNEDPSNLQRVAQFYQTARSRSQLVDAVIDAVQTGKRPSPILRALAELGFPLVITTNYDQLFESALIAAGKQPRVAVYTPHLEPTTDYGDPTAESPVVFKTYGDIGRPETIVITNEDHIELILRMADREHYDPVPSTVKQCLASWTTLLVGFSLADYKLKLLFKMLRSRLDTASVPDTYSVDDHPDPLTIQVWGRSDVIYMENVWKFVPQLYEAVLGTEFHP